VANKRYPGEREYFAPQVEMVLFPPAPPDAAEASGGRWIRDPVAASLELGRTARSEVELAIDLLDELVEGGSRFALAGHEPLRELALQLIGGAHPNVMHRAHIFVAARLPADVSSDDEAIWRRAIGRGYTFDKAIEAMSENKDRDKRRTEQIGDATATGRGQQ
jgi:hypothetical protein